MCNTECNKEELLGLVLKGECVVQSVYDNKEEPLGLVLKGECVLLSVYDNSLTSDIIQLKMAKFSGHFNSVRTYYC